MDLKAFVNEEKEQLSLQEEIVKLNKLLSEKIKKKIPEIAEKSFTDFREYFSIKAFDVTVSANTITAKINDKKVSLRHEDFDNNFAGTHLPFDLEINLKGHQKYRLGIFNDNENNINHSSISSNANKQNILYWLENFDTEKWYFKILEKNYSSKKYLSINEILDDLIDKL